MGEATAISWATSTFNPWIGCTKVSPGCANCYAEALMDQPYGRVRWGKGQERSRTSAGNWRQPIAWNRAAERARKGAVGSPPERPRVFCASLADWLDDEVPVEWLRDLLALVFATPELDWLLLTKRPQNFLARVGAVAALECKHQLEGFPPRTACGVIFARLWLACARGEDLQAGPPENVWAGTTVEDQQRADERVPALLAIPARVRFLSCEPLLGPISIPALAWDGIHWVIVGGESGTRARPMDLAWARQLRDVCAPERAGVPVFVKQLGGARDKRGDLEDMPADLRIREVPRGR